MTNIKAIHTVGSSLISYLNSAFENGGSDLTGIDACDCQLFASAQFLNPDDELTSPAITLYLYRVTFNEHLRNTQRANQQQVPLALDLHYLLTVWSNDASEEHVLLAWAMRELYLRPVLDSSTLISDAEWSPGDVIQIIPAELSTEDMMRIWDALEPSYRLSVSYVARVVRIDVDNVEGRPVVARRMSYSDRVTP
jgi:hypothetical protein